MPRLLHRLATRVSHAALAGVVVVASLCLGAGAVAAAGEAAATAPAPTASPSAAAPSGAAPRSAPVGIVSLPRYTTTPDVTLLVRVVGAEPFEWRAANAGDPWSDWAPLPAADFTGARGVPWTLSAGDGDKTVAVQIRDAAQQVADLSATTTLDTVAPELLSTDPAGGAALAAPPAVVTLHFSEPLATGARPQIAIVATPPWTVPKPLPVPTVHGADVRVAGAWLYDPHTTYQMTLTQVTDAAGNAAADASVTFSVDRLPTGVHLAAAAATVTFGSSLALRGRASISGYPWAAGAVLSISRQIAGEPAAGAIGTVKVARDSRFRCALRPRADATYAVAFPDGPDYIGSSDAIAVAVRPRLTLKPPLEMWLGGRGSFSGAVAPAHPGATVTIQRYVRKAWSDWRRVTLDSRSRFALRWHPRSAGVWRFRLTMAADALHAAGHSRAVRVVVNRPNPHHVPMMFRNYLVIDISECHLYYYRYGRVVKVFDCVLGKPSTPTPTGQWAVYAKQPHPGGPFGAYVLWYNGGYGIHGTNEEFLLRLWPRYFSHGCCRLYNSAITWLYPRIPVGTPVRNVY